jgi:hypothetical protein
MGPKLALCIPVILTYNSPFRSMFFFEVVRLMSTFPKNSKVAACATGASN